MSQPLKYYIETFGCQMNVADSDRMASLLDSRGAIPTAFAAEADVLLLNTCSVREKPEQKVYARLCEWRSLKRKRPEVVVAVCGCQAQREGEAILANAPWVDLILGTANVERLPNLLDQVRSGTGPMTALEIPQRGTPAWLSAEPHMTRREGELIPVSGVGGREAGEVGDSALEGAGAWMGTEPHEYGGVVGSASRGRLKAFVPIILGCDFACTFCVVPKTRGPERSRSVSQILGEIRAHAQSGAREVVLLGQTVDAYRAYYHSGEPPGSRVYSLADLIWLIEEIDGIERVRFTSPHPAYMDLHLIDAVARAPKACEWIHLPVQSGDDIVLRRMARRYSRERYIQIVREIRDAMPLAAITTDIIVGFPGETREQFEATLSLVEEVRFDGAYTFAYSRRPDTPASGWVDTVPDPEKNRWLNELIATQNRISREKNVPLVGEAFEILVERPTGKVDGQLTGLTRTNKTVNFQGTPDLVGQFVTVRATEAHQWGFSGEIVGRARW